MTRVTLPCQPQQATAGKDRLSSAKGWNGGGSLSMFIREGVSLVYNFPLYPLISRVLPRSCGSLQPENSLKLRLENSSCKSTYFCAVLQDSKPVRWHWHQLARQNQLNKARVQKSKHIIDRSLFRSGLTGPVERRRTCQLVPLQPCARGSQSTPGSWAAPSVRARVRYC